MAPLLEDLRPGDLLLYRPRGLFGWLVAIKTASRVSHCEVFDGLDARGHAWALASRDGRGVDRYPYRAAELFAVYRVGVPYSHDAVRQWFRTVVGQGYDWIGLLGFFIAQWQGRTNRKMFCSEFLARAVREGIWGAFTERVHVGEAWRGQPPNRRVMVRLRLDPWAGRDADGLAPDDVQQSPLLDLVWSSRTGMQE